MNSVKTPCKIIKQTSVELSILRPFLQQVDYDLVLSDCAVSGHLLYRAHVGATTLYGSRYRRLLHAKSADCSERRLQDVTDILQH